MYKLSKNIHKTQVLEKPTAFLCHKSSEIELVEFSLKLDESIPMHINNVKVVFYIIEGAGQLTIGSNTLNLQMADIIEVEPDVERAWHNPNKELLKVLVIKLHKSKSNN